MNFSEEVKSTLWKMIDDMELNKRNYLIDPNKNFTREKKWDFSTLIKFIVSMEGQSLKHELHKYFGYTIDCPSNSSFNQRRAQIKVDAFEQLFHSFTKHYNTSETLHKGYVLIACDGCDVNFL